MTRRPAFAATGLRRPAADWQLALLLVMLTSGFVSIAVSQLALGAALLTLLYRWLVRGEAPPVTGLERTAFLLAAWALVMIPFSTNVAQSALFYRRFYLFTVIWVAASCATSEPRRRLLLGFLLAGALATCLHDQAQHLLRTGSLFAQRMTGTFNAMTNGAMLMMAALTCAGFLVAPGTRRRLRWVLAAAMLPLVVGMLMTMTRSVQMGLVAGVGALLLAIRPRLFAWFTGVLAVGAVLLALQGDRLASHGMWMRLSPQYLLAGKDTELRLEMWRGGWNMVARHPLTGVGDRGLEEISPEYYTSAHGIYFGHLHSNIVHMAAIWGVPGLLLGQAFIFAGLWHLARRWRALRRQPGGPAASAAAAGWTLGAIAVWAGFYAAGFTEWYFGDAEPMLIYLAIIGAALGAAAPRPRPAPAGAANVDAATVASFGDEWERYDQSSLSPVDLHAAFDRYFAVFPWERLPNGAVGFDMGCGTGRWAQLVAPRVGRLHCVDPSAAALAVAQRNLAGCANVDFELATTGSTALPPDSQDFGYSLGVLHHIPDTAAALADCVRLLKPGAPFLVYLYYRFDNRPLWFRLVWRASDALRAGICRLPGRLKAVPTTLLAAAVYWPLARLAHLGELLGLDVTHVPLSFYRDKSFYVMRTDSRDRFGTPLEQRFTRREIRAMMTAAGLGGIVCSDEEPYWCCVGFRTGDRADPA